MDALDRLDRFYQTVKHVQGDDSDYAQDMIAGMEEIIKLRSDLAARDAEIERLKAEIGSLAKTAVMVNESLSAMTIERDELQERFDSIKWGKYICEKELANERKEKEFLLKHFEIESKAFELAIKAGELSDVTYWLDYFRKKASEK